MHVNEPTETVAARAASGRVRLPEGFMGSYVAVACQHDPASFLARFGAEPDPAAPGVFVAGGLPVMCGADFVVVNTLHAPSETVATVLAEVARALPGLQTSSTGLAVGLDGGEPDADTTFDSWTAHWIRDDALDDRTQTVTRGVFGGVANAISETGLSAASASWLDDYVLDAAGMLVPKDTQ